MIRVVRIGTGMSMVTVGVVLLVLPGPGVLTIAGGLAVLAPEFDWARKSLDWMKNSVAKPPPSPDGDTSPNAPLGEETPLADQNRPTHPNAPLGEETPLAD